MPREGDLAREIVDRLLNDPTPFSLGGEEEDEIAATDFLDALQEMPGAKCVGSFFLGVERRLIHWGLALNFLWQLFYRPPLVCRILPQPALRQIIPLRRPARSIPVLINASASWWRTGDATNRAC